MSTCSTAHWVGNGHWPGYLNYLNEVEWMLGFATILEKKCVYTKDVFCLRCPANKSNLQSLQSHMITAHCKLNPQNPRFFFYAILFSCNYCYYNH